MLACAREGNGGDMRRIVAAGLSVVLAVSLGTRAAADWVEAESENFVFYGEVTPERAQETVRELEIFRSTVLTLMGVEAAEPEIRKVRIFGERSVKGVQKLTGMKGIAGVYTKANDYPVFVTVAAGKRRRDVQSHQTTLHELSHHITHRHTAHFHPRWYDEGLATYLATFEIEGDVVSVGAPTSPHGLILRRRGWTDADIVFGSVAQYPWRTGGHV